MPERFSLRTGDESLALSPHGQLLHVVGREAVQELRRSAAGHFNDRTARQFGDADARGEGRVLRQGFGRDRHELACRANGTSRGSSSAFYRPLQQWRLCRSIAGWIGRHCQKEYHCEIRRGNLCCIPGSRLAVLAGCYQSPAPQASTPQVPVFANGATSKPAAYPADIAGLSANAILKRLLTTYRGAATYQDEGIVRLQFKQAGQSMGDQWPCAVKFARPNKLSLAAYQATVKCDGHELVAKITDEASRDLDGQFLVRPAPKELKLIDLASDEILYGIVSSELRRQPIQLELLLESGGLAAAFGSNIACKRLDDGQALAANCFRIEVPSPGGSYVFWIDQADFVLRRLDYPAAALLPGLASDPGVTDLRLSAELIGAKIGSPIDDSQFTLRGAGQCQEDAVARPPRPAAAVGIVREKPRLAAIYHARRRPAHQRRPRGQAAVLVWYHADPACEATLQEVAKARQRVSDADCRVLCRGHGPHGCEQRPDSPAARCLEGRSARRPRSGRARRFVAQDQGASGGRRARRRGPRADFPGRRQPEPGRPARHKSASG